DASADLLQVALDDPGVDRVPEHPAEVIDDDVVDVALCFYPGDHLLEGRAFVDAGGAAARLDELVDDVSVELFSFSLTGHPLRWDGDTLGIVISVDLTWRRHS